MTQPDVHDTLDDLIKVETAHLAFWQRFFNLKLEQLDLGRRIELSVMMLVCRLFGSTAVHLVLEAIEVHGVRNILLSGGHTGANHWSRPCAEFSWMNSSMRTCSSRHLRSARSTPERIRNIFLGLNDGLVEILGAVSGFFGAFGSATMVLITASTTAGAGAVSMAAGAFLALNTEKDVKSTEVAKKYF